MISKFFKNKKDDIGKKKNSHSVCVLNFISVPYVTIYIFLCFLLNDFMPRIINHLIVKIQYINKHIMLFSKSLW